MDFRVLGPLEVRDGDGPIALGGAKQRAVLAHLLLRANATVPAERLIDQVWGDEPPAAARNVLQTYVSRLRKALGADRLEHGSGGYVLHADPEEIDARRFERSSRRRGGRLRATPPPRSSCTARPTRCGAARRSTTSPARRRCAARSRHLEELRIAATEERVVAELALGRHAELVPELETLTARHPLREALWAHLMIALYRSGRQADALAAYRRARDVLVDELGHRAVARAAAARAAGPRARTRRSTSPARRCAATGCSSRSARARSASSTARSSRRSAARSRSRSSARRSPTSPSSSAASRPRRSSSPGSSTRTSSRSTTTGASRTAPTWSCATCAAAACARRSTDGPVDARAGARAVAEQVGAALAVAHRHGVVHRDVKPANILLDEDGNAYLSDFGIARDVAARPRAGARGHRQQRVLPLAGGGARRGADARADVYSLGVVLFEMLAGRHPFAGLAPEALASARVPRLGADVPAGLAAVVQRATAQDPPERYADAAALVAALAGVQRAVAAPAGPARNPYKGLRPFLEADAATSTAARRWSHGCADRLDATRLLALVGPVGERQVVGRARRARARCCRAEGWFVARDAAGDDPVAELAAALVGLATAPVGTRPGDALGRGPAARPARVPSCCSSWTSSRSCSRSPARTARAAFLAELRRREPVRVRAHAARRLPRPSARPAGLRRCPARGDGARPAAGPGRARAGDHGTGRRCRRGGRAGAGRRRS